MSHEDVDVHKFAVDTENSFSLWFWKWGSDFIQAL
jgi:hypothetical protein